MFIILFIFFPISFIYTKDKPTQEDHLYRSIKISPIPIYLKKIQVTLSEQHRLPLKHLSKLANNNIPLNLNIASYFLNILASPDVLTWFTTGGPIRRKIKHIGLTKDHRKTIEKT